MVGIDPFTDPDQSSTVRDAIVGEQDLVWLKDCHRLALTCPNLPAFQSELTSVR